MPGASLRTYSCRVARTGRSKSTRLLLAIGVVGIVFAAVVLTPRWWPDSDGLVDVQPQMLVVHAAAKGQVDLGDGLAVSLFTDGMRLLHGGDVVFQTVPLGAFVSAGSGSVTRHGGQPSERLTATLDNLEITGRSSTPGGVRYAGRIFSRTRSRPFSMTVTRTDQRINLSVAVPGSQLLVLHTAFEHLTVGVAGRLPARNLKDSVWWVRSAAPQNLTGAAYTTFLGSTVGVVSPGMTALDIRHEGRTDIHVWAPAITVTVSWYGRSRAGATVHPVVWTGVPARSAPRQRARERV